MTVRVRVAVELPSRWSAPPNAMTGSLTVQLVIRESDISSLPSVSTWIAPPTAVSVA